MTFLIVRPNEAVGACLHEGASASYIGAHIDHEKSKAAGGSVYVFSAEPVKVHLTAYTVRKVQDGDLLAADEATAKLCGIAWSASKPIAKAKPSKGIDIKRDDSDPPPRA